MLALLWVLFPVSDALEQTCFQNLSCFLLLGSAGFLGLTYVRSLQYLDDTSVSKKPSSTSLAGEPWNPQSHHINASRSRMLHPKCVICFCHGAISLKR